MIDPNKHVSDFLDYYFNFNHSPEYAILIKGAWGAGKSWFIQKALDKFQSDSGKYLYVSLYGVVSFDDIENAFFEQMHPVLASKKMKLASKLLKGVLKATIKVDLDGDGNGETTKKISVDELGIPDYLKDTDGFVLVFDDLERCSIEIGSLLGYINQFVEHQGYKVVIIANENEILSRESQDKCYSRAKEKLIGKTFELVPNTKLALESFISSASGTIKAFYQDNNDSIVSVYNFSECKNLRHLKQALWDFERLFNALPETAFDKVEMKEELLKKFLCYSFEIRSVNFSVNQMARIKDSMYEEYLTRGEEGKNKTIYSVLSEKYPMIDFSEPIVEESIWIDFFDKGIINEAKIKESIESNKYYQNENTDNWIKLWHFHDLSDAEFDILVDLVSKDVTARKYKNHFVVKHIAGLFMRLSEINLINKTAERILIDFKNYVDYLLAENLLPNEIYDNSLDFDEDSWGGLGFAGRDIEEFELFNEYLDEKIKESRVQSLPNVANELLNLMETNNPLFVLRLILCNKEENIYYNIPILKCINPEDFVAKLISLSNDSFRRTGSMFKQRYSIDRFHVDLIKELDWLKQVKNIMEKQREKFNGKLSGYRISTFIDRYISPAIEQLEQEK